MRNDPASHADDGHIIQITSVPMFCITCDIPLPDTDIDEDDSTPITDD